MTNRMFVRILAGITIAGAIAGCDHPVDFYRHSIVEIVASPMRFIDRPMSLKGYYGENIKGPFLFLTREHAAMQDLSNAVRFGKTIDGTQFASIAECRLHFLVVFGRFGELEHGGYGLTDIERAVILGVDDDDDDVSGTCYRASTLGDA